MDDSSRTRQKFPRGRKSQTRRKLNLASRVRNRTRAFADGVLGLDVVWSGLFVVVIMLLLIPRGGGALTDYQVGEKVLADIRAPFDIEIADSKLTNQRRQEALAATQQVYVWNSERRLVLARELSSAFERGRETLAQIPDNGDPDILKRRLDALENLGSRDELEALIRAEFAESIERELGAALAYVMRGPIVSNKALVEREGVIRLIQVPSQQEETIETFERFRDTGTVRVELFGELKSRLNLDEETRRLISEFTCSFLDTTVYFDAAETQRRRERATRDLPPVMVRVARGEMLIREGERLDADTRALLDAARRGAGAEMGVEHYLALLLIVCTLGFFLWRYSTYHQRGFRKLKHLYSLLVMVLLGMMCLGQAIMWLAALATATLDAPFSQLDAYTYLIPLGSGAILIALLANGRIAMVYASFASILFAAQHDFNFYVGVWATIVQLSGIYVISSYRERAALLRAGLVVGGAGAIGALALEILRGNLEPISVTLYGVGLAFLGGAVGVGLVISFALPLLEGLFNVLTDIRLLELSNVNNPLLSELAVRAPGSYNHSLVVGTLAEEGAKAVGANSLFCRVAAFYHDIGKVNHAEYFVENQRGVNPHDKLTPSMSALIISSHVKDGIKMAREAGLPEQIIDIIPQHHGTKKMAYFYEKARSQADPARGPIKEEDFRYPGPKPQTREGAIFMLADAVEAAARTIEDPSPNRLMEMIRKITNSIVLDDQFDECDLTFADLDRIQQAFLRLLVSMYHRRVDYPGFDFNKPAGAS